jgi:hemerythrin
MRTHSKSPPQRNRPGHGRAIEDIIAELVRNFTAEEDQLFEELLSLLNECNNLESHKKLHMLFVSCAINAARRAQVGRAKQLSNCF